MARANSSMGWPAATNPLDQNKIRGLKGRGWMLSDDPEEAGDPAHRLGQLGIEHRG
jgi:hypothetical protein